MVQGCRALVSIVRPLGQGGRGHLVSQFHCLDILFCLGAGLERSPAQGHEGDILTWACRQIEMPLEISAVGFAQ